MSSSRVVSGSTELRQFPRKNILQWPLLSFEMLIASEAGPSQRRRGVLLNLSEGGLAVQPFRPLTRGDVGWLQLGVPGADKPLVSEGRVEWVGPNGRVGIRFLESPGEARDLLRRWLSHKPLRQAGPPISSETAAGLTEFEAALQLIAERARYICRASGAAIAVGDRMGMECRAASGSAPDVGTPVQPEAGLSGHCITSAKLVNCADVRSDPRVDPAVARELETRSVLIVPSFASGDIAGLLEVFSPQPHAFDKRQVSRLKLLAGMIGAAIEENRAEEWNRVAADIFPNIQVSEPREAAAPPAEWLPTEWSLTYPAEAPPAKEVPETSETPTKEVLEVASSKPPEGTTDAFPMMSYVDSPSFESPGFALKVGVGFAALAMIIALAWHGIQSRGQRKVSAAAAVTESANQGDTTGQQIALKLAPPKTPKKVGSTFSVNVTLDGAKNLASVPLEIQYDPKLLQFVSVANGDLLSKDGESVALVHREQSGAIQLTATRPPSAPGASGNGTVFTLVFLAKAPGKASFSIKPAVLRDSRMNAVSVGSADSATVTIRG